MTCTVRTRFAPSPTGFLHVGGARTALFAWLYARHHQGEFILRIEDTDRERSTDEAVQLIHEGMAWLGLDWDEGPYYQTQRFDRYALALKQLLDSGQAYRCYCSKERLTELRETQLIKKQKPRYDGRCRDVDCHDDAPYVIRFRSPQKGAVSFDDRIRGEITIQNSELDDLILARTDGTPTYNFTVVVDDWEMRITHVIRGEDHINNTPRQIHLLRALGAEIPVYAHLPMIHGSDGKKLSKRHGAVSVLQYREAGYLPEALVNYLVRLGWAHGDQEIFSIDEMVQYFDLSHVSRSPAVFNFEKLDWLNQHYFKTTDPTLIAKPLSDQFQVLGVSDKNGPSLEAIVRMQAERCKTLKEMAERSRYFYESVETYDEKALKKHFKPEVLPGLRLVRAHLAELSHWDQEALHRVVVEVAESLELKLGKLAQPIRIAMTGNTVSPPIDLTLLYIGRERVLERLDHAIQFLEGD